VPYRTPSDPHGPWRLPIVDEGGSRRHVMRFGKTLAAALVGAGLVAGAADLAMRPTLGPDLEESSLVVYVPPMRMMDLGGGTTEDGERDDSERRYDVDAALRSDESTRPDDVEAGSGPSRRRYVRDDPNVGLIGGTITLVTDTTELEVSARSRRRRSL
jgi:hypothetical protein